MKRGKKPGKGPRFRAGMQVRSLRPQDEGATGVVLSADRKRTGWCYSVLFEGWYKVALRAEDELAEVC